MSASTARTWYPQAYFAHAIDDNGVLHRLNETGGLAVSFESAERDAVDLSISGSQSENFSLWTTRSRTGFVTRPKITNDLYTIRIVESGRMVRRDLDEDHVGTSGIGMFVSFPLMRNEEASRDFRAISGTITHRRLLDCCRALEGEEVEDVPRLRPLVEMHTPPLRAFAHVFALMHRRTADISRHDDLFHPLLEEILVYQLLTAWPQISPAPRRRAPASAAYVSRAVDFIDANLAASFTLSDIARAAGVSVRSLQLGFRSELDTTPVQFVVARRLERAHADLRAAAGTGATISQIARRWGFAHMSDFSRRYRLKFGVTPSRTFRGR